MFHLRSPRVILAIGAVAAIVSGAVVASERSASAMASAANAFLTSLSPAERQQATFPFEGDERLRWNFIPPQAFERHGLTMKAMNDAQRQRAHDLLKTGLSQRGYMTATAIMQLESVLGGIEGRARGGGQQAENFPRDPLEYYVSVFGTPSSRGAWGWRVEGHHVSLRFNVVDGKYIASSPSFFGSNPAEVREGPKQGLRILANEEDPARALVLALDEQQKAKGVIQNVAPNDILTTNKLEVSPLSPVGITADALNAKQRELLMQVIDAYTSAMADDIAADRMSRLRAAGIEKIAFAWAGPAERGQKHYYRVQGPTFLIEYDNTQNNGNHIHSVWRDFAGDFGRDILREHLRTTAH